MSQDPAEARRIAARAMALMARHDIPPTPENYTIWYSYAAGSNPALVRSLDILISNKTPFTPERNQEIYAQFFDSQAYAQAVEDTSSQLEDALDRVQQLISKAGRDTSAYGRRMSSLSGALNEETQTLEQIRETVGAMVQETRAILAKNQRLEQRLRDSTEEMATLRQDLETVRQDALTDALTGAANRKQFDQHLRAASASAMEAGEPLTVMLMDIDRFKAFNDRYGHSTGDEVLKLVARHLKEHVKGRDLPARFGGEEFAVILPDTRLEDAVRLADRIRAHLAHRQVTHRSTQQIYDRVTISVGVGSYRFGEPLEQLVQRCDDALYAAKRAGRNRVCSEAMVDTPRASSG